MLDAPVTWILLADRTVSHIAENRGAGTGLAMLPGKSLHAEKDSGHADQQGRGMNGMGRAQHKLDKHVEATPYTETFARQVMNSLEKDYRSGEFQRLIICAGPSMLGLLRRYVPTNLSSAILAEVTKDLTSLPISKLQSHFNDTIRL